MNESKRKHWAKESIGSSITNRLESSPSRFGRVVICMNGAISECYFEKASELGYFSEYSCWKWPGHSNRSFGKGIDITEDVS